MYSLILLTQIHLSLSTNSHLCEVLLCYMVLSFFLQYLGLNHKTEYILINFVTLLPTAPKQWS